MAVYVPQGSLTLEVAIPTPAPSLSEAGGTMRPLKEAENAWNDHDDPFCLTPTCFDASWDF
jgi:hypothetical protein